LKLRCRKCRIVSNGVCHGAQGPPRRE
jgi:hypothetical protein